MNGDTNICQNCGSANRPGARFCKACGKPLNSAAPASAKPQTRRAGGKPAARSAPKPRMPSIPRPVPWQVAVGDKIPAQSIQSILKAAVQTAGGTLSRSRPAQKPAQKGSSLRGPALQAFGAAVLEAATSALTEGLEPGAAATKLGLAGINLVAGLIAGERRGVASFIMLLATGGLALLQGGSLLDTLRLILDYPSMLGSLLPSGVTQLISMLIAARTGLKALKK
ncbi:MAG: zinc ribbon domain-containing protein [Anaerolineales bacterium]|nr:zinc ribbon domain-containing protein [Anaerolineales bacterium]